MSASSAPQGAETEYAKQFELEQFLNIEESCVDTPMHHRDCGQTRKDGSLFNHRVAIGSLIVLLGFTCLMGLSTLFTRHIVQMPMGSSLNLNEMKNLRTDKTIEQQADHAVGVVYQSMEKANSAITVINRLDSDIYHAQHFFNVLKNSSKWAKNMSLSLRNKIKEKLTHLLPAKGVNKTNMTAMKIAAIRSMMNLSDTTRDINKHDGNVCADDEELLGNLCYKKCSTFDDGKYPVRTTPFSCCQSKPCGLFNQKVSMKICSGFNVAGDSNKDACPHAPGACLKNEELHMGMCYKKCSLLTNFALPFRLAPATCCKEESKLACMNPQLSNTSSDFNVGGGDFYRDLTSPSQPHQPIPTLTEIQPIEKKA